MENDKDIEVIEYYSYEIIERIHRFIIHLEEIENQFYIDDSTASDKLNFIQKYKDSLFKILEIVIIGLNELKDNNSNEEKYIDIQLKSIAAINELHSKYLSILPRPIEPVELARFRRVIYKQIVQLNKKNKQDISISINEKIGEEIDIDPLHDFKTDYISPLIASFNVGKANVISDIIGIEDAKIYITIPRIDAGNTFRWSSLIHEMCHSLMSLIEFENNSIEKDFLKFVNEDKMIKDFFSQDIAEVKFLPSNITLKSWLNECWCDTFSCILIGPSLYFSQYLTFINDQNNDCLTHPPALFRLYLIEAIISSNRFPKALSVYIENKYLKHCEKVLLKYQNQSYLNFNNCHQLSRILNSFVKYIKKLFFTTNDNIGISGNENLNENLSKLVNKYVNFYPDIIKQLVDRLNLGLPIPSIRIIRNSKYEETPTFIQEIFLTSWISRIDVLLPEVINQLNNFQQGDDIKKFYKDFINKLIFRHDQAVLKSIQVSEWFDFYNNGKSRPKIITVYPPKLNSSNDLKGILVDHEIKKMILEDEIKILPIMNIDKQIGTSSIDIRLGTSFQLFYPDQYGIVDFTEKNSNTNSKYFSKKVNLDFIEGITIAPGQFLLGHSMEYIKLPDYICANLEGRSSFARLGIEIHMTAGFIDPGFEGVLTFEIYNAGPTTVKLYPGLRIAQMRFEKTKVPKKPYGRNNVVKYKGFLEHNVSRQNFDYEVQQIIKWKKEPIIIKN